MSSSLYIIGIVPPDDRFKEMLDVRSACLKAKIDVPEEVCNFFNYETPDPEGVHIDLKHKDKAVTKYRDDSSEGYEVDLSKIPSHIKRIRFFIG